MNSLKKASCKPNKFLLRLFNMLSDTKHANIITWSDSALSFEKIEFLNFQLQSCPSTSKIKTFRTSSDN